MNSSTYLIVESASNQTTMITSRNDQRASESPPPPYITPPGTILRNMNLTSLSASMKQICPIRRTWLRRSAQYPQSSNDHSSLDGPSSFTNAEALDTNRMDCVTSNRQLKDSPKEVRIVHEDTVQEDITVSEENNRHVSEEDDELIDK